MRLIGCLFLVSLAAQAIQLKDPQGLLKKTNDLYAGRVDYNKIDCEGFAVYEKYLHGFSYQCDESECQGQFEYVMRHAINYQVHCQDGQTVLYNTEGETFDLKGMANHENMVEFYLTRILGKNFYENGILELKSLSETTFVYYAGLPFEKKVDAHVLDMNYHPKEGSSSWRIRVVFDPSQKLIKQILELKIEDDTWYKLMYL